jgi:hypothetical protein
VDEVQLIQSAYRCRLPQRLVVVSVAVTPTVR